MGGAMAEASGAGSTSSAEATMSEAEAEEDRALASLEVQIWLELDLLKGGSSSAAPSGSGPLWSSGPAPCAFPKVWPPAVKATVSSSFMAMRLNVSRMS